MTESHEVHGIASTTISSEVPVATWSEPSTSGGRPRWLPAVLAAVVVVGLAAAFAGGYLLKDDAKAERNRLEKRVQKLTSERDATDEELADSKQVVSECRRVVKGYGEYVETADALTAQWEEIVVAADAWWATEPGSTAEAEAEAHLQTLVDGMGQQRDAMQQQVGSLRSQASDCLGGSVASVRPATLPVR